MTADRKISRRQMLGQAAGTALAGMVLPGCPSSRQEPLAKTEPKRIRRTNRRPPRR